MRHLAGARDEHTAKDLPVAGGARFEISLTRAAFIARPLNEAARRALVDG